MFKHCPIANFICPYTTEVDSCLYCGFAEKGENKIDGLSKCPLPGYKPKDSMRAGTVRQYQRRKGRSTFMVTNFS